MMAPLVNIHDVCDCVNLVWVVSESTGAVVSLVPHLEVGLSSVTPRRVCRQSIALFRSLVTDGNNPPGVGAFRIPRRFYRIK